MIRELALESIPALTGPGPENKLNVNYPYPSKKVSDYTLGILWDELTPKVMTRILRDCFQLAGICKANRTRLRVASASTAMDKYLKFLDVKRTSDLKQATYWRVYCIKEAPDSPENAELTDIINVKLPEADPQRLLYDPTFPKKIEYVDVQRIDHSLPLYQSPPSGPADFEMQEPW